LCLMQVGLDGVRMLDPNTGRTLRIYPLETVTRWDVSNSSLWHLCNLSEF